MTLCLCCILFKWKMWGYINSIHCWWRKDWYNLFAETLAISMREEIVRSPSAAALLDTGYRTSWAPVPQEIRERMVRATWSHMKAALQSPY